MDGSSEWIDWRRESYPALDQYWHCLLPDPAARLFVIETEDDLRVLCHEYGITSHTSLWGSWEAPLLDFEYLSTVCDGLHVTRSAVRALHTSYPYDLNAWDVESTLWFAWSFVEVHLIHRPGDSVSLEQ